MDMNNAMSTPAAGHAHTAHGSYRGHVLPGSMFLLWSLWWTLNLYARYLMCCKTKRPFVSRPWFLWKWRPTLVMEPLLKILLPGFGILVELRLGHKAWRHITDAQGHIIARTLNNWQHSVMYGTIVISGCVDLLSHYAGAGQLPPGTEQGFLAMGFLVNGILMAFHLKGHELEVKVHLLLVFIMFACALLAMLELQHPDSPLLAITRSACVFFLGSWFCHIGHILFAGDPAWGLHDMGAVMFLPVVFCTHMLLLAIGHLLVFTGMHWYFKQYGSFGLDDGEAVVQPRPDVQTQQELAVLIAKNNDE